MVRGREKEGNNLEGGSANLKGVARKPGKSRHLRKNAGIDDPERVQLAINYVLDLFWILPKHHPEVSCVREANHGREELSLSKGVRKLQERGPHSVGPVDHIGGLDLIMRVNHCHLQKGQNKTQCLHGGRDQIQHPNSQVSASGH